MTNATPIPGHAPGLREPHPHPCTLSTSPTAHTIHRRALRLRELTRGLVKLMPPSADAAAASELAEIVEVEASILRAEIAVLHDI